MWEVIRFFSGFLCGGVIAGMFLGIRIMNLEDKLNAYEEGEL